MPKGSVLVLRSSKAAQSLSLSGVPAGAVRPQTCWMSTACGRAGAGATPGSRAIGVASTATSRLARLVVTSRCLTLSAAISNARTFVLVAGLSVGGVAFLRKVVGSGGFSLEKIGRVVAKGIAPGSSHTMAQGHTASDLGTCTFQTGPRG